MRHRTSSDATYIISIATTWFLGLLTTGLKAIPVFTTKVNSQYFVITTHTLLFISLLIMLNSYLKIRTRLKSTSNQFALSQINRANPNRNLRLLKTIFLVIAVSFVFGFPTLVVHIVGSFCLQCFPTQVLWLTNALHLANSLVNPFVYIFNLPLFKTALRKLWRKR